MKNLEILAGAIPATKMATAILPAGSILAYKTVNVFGEGNEDIVTIDQIETAEQARATSVKFMDTTSFKFYYVPLGSLLTFKVDDTNNVYSKMKADDKFVDTITISEQKPVKDNGIVMYPYTSYKAYDALLSKAGKALATAIRETPTDTKLTGYSPAQYLHRGKFRAELRELRKSAAATLLIAGATPLHSFTVEVATA